MVIVASRVESGGRDEDRLLIEHDEGRLLVVVADGAGGAVGGALAAELVCELVVEMFRGSSEDDWEARLRTIDSNLVFLARGGSTTAVVVEISDHQIVGASVGDSGAWLVSEAGSLDLTERQVRKPLLGTGAAEPVGFGPVPLHGRLVVGTDGLFKYASRARLASGTLEGTLDGALTALIDSVRMESGGLQDDVAVVVCERTG